MTATLYQRIQQFYDASSGLWEQIWGEHMHHGYYGPRGDRRLDRRQAQIDLIVELLAWGQINQADRILDVGCGIGGSSLYLAEKYQAAVTGITLSPVQAERAKQRANMANIPATFLVADALQQPFADQSFDLVWSLESGEHMPDKKQFLQECYRVLKPGGCFLMATWCHRSIEPPKPPLTKWEQEHLAKIYQVYCLPYVISLPKYRQLAQEIGFQHIRTADWSQAVAPFWDRVIGSALNPMALLGVVQAGWTTIQAALSLGLMREGYQTGLIRFGLLYGIK